MRLLVTGGAGFIGSHVVEHALAEGHEVAVLDDFSHGDPENVPAGVRVLRVDLRDRDRVIGALGAFGPTHVSHHAAWIDAPGSLKNPREHFENNVMGSIHLIEACVAVGVERVVFASSGGAIYGETRNAATEDTLPRPENPYGAGKLAVEHLLAACKEFTSALLRYPNVYGPRQRSGVVGIFMRAALRGEELVVFGEDLGGLRTYAFVEDVARVNVATLYAPHSFMVNVPGFHSNTMHLAQVITDIADSASIVRSDSARQGDVRISRIGSDEFHMLGGCGHRTNLRDGLLKTFEWWKKQ